MERTIIGYRQRLPGSLPGLLTLLRLLRSAHLTFLRHSEDILVVRTMNSVSRYSTGTLE
ncbi:mCG1027118 [Mus musculus]|nr:mCG1027118 [Mus musculus]